MEFHFILSVGTQFTKTKVQISFTVTGKLISAFVFATRIVQFLLYLYPKFQDSNFLLRLYRKVCVAPGRNSQRPVFSRRGPYVIKLCGKCEFEYYNISWRFTDKVFSLFVCLIYLYYYLPLPLCLRNLAFETMPPNGENS